MTNSPLYANQWYRLDELESFINDYGRITVKQPDVWGQSRIMQHRQEFEQQMVTLLPNYSVTYQGSRSFTSQTGFGNSAGLGIGLSGGLPVFTGVTTNATTTNGTVPLSLTNTVLSLITNMVTPVPLPSNNVLAFGGNNSIQLDPDSALDQQAEYIKHLQELRRINEGDDTADAAGYSLYLLRIPVSVDPGQKTKKGYGAEVSVHVVTDTTTNLMSNTFPRLVINDLALQLSQVLLPLVTATNLADLYKEVTNSPTAAQLFSPDDINETPNFLADDAGNPLTHFLHTNLSAGTIAQSKVRPVDTNALKQLLADDLNRVIQSGDSASIAFADITNLNVFGGKMKNPSKNDRLSRHLAEKYTNKWSAGTDGYRVLTNYSGALDDILQSNLVLILNDEITNGTPFDPSYYTGLKLSADTLNLLWQNPTNGPDLVWLKRLILLDAYSGQIAKTHTIYSIERFANVTLSADTLHLLRQNPQDSNLVALNRLLIHDANSNSLASAFASTNSTLKTIFALRAQVQEYKEYINAKEQSDTIKSNLVDVLGRLMEIQAIKTATSSTNSENNLWALRAQIAEFHTNPGTLSARGITTLQGNLTNLTNLPATSLSNITNLNKQLENAADNLKSAYRPLSNAPSDLQVQSANAIISNQLTLITNSSRNAGRQLQVIKRQLHAIKAKLDPLMGPLTSKVTSTRFNRSAFFLPNNELINIYGSLDSILLAKKIHDDLDITNNSPEIQLRIQRYLFDNLDVAYKLLQRRDLFTNTLQLTNLTEDIHNLNEDNIMNAQYLITGTLTNIADFDSVAPLLVWPVAVESALLANKLQGKLHSIDDTIDFSGDPFFLRPSDSVPNNLEKAFKVYVEQHWPIHVFALDPVSQDQNIADSASYRNILQLSFAAAIATGKINASDAASYTKAISKDLSAILINQTIVGFSDGPDKFGWRFLPRFSTAKSVKDEPLERGERECTALIILPSFIPKVELETRIRWFGLDCPAKTEPKLERMYYLSEQWQRRIESYRESFFVSPDSVKVKELSKKLLKTNDSSYSFSSCLMASFSSNTISALKKYNDPNNHSIFKWPDWTLIEAVPRELNQIIKTNRSLFAVASESNIKLSRETRDLAWHYPHDDRELERLNRLILQDAYPDEISRKDVFLHGDHDYLWGDRDKGMRLLEELKSALPLQSLNVGLPYETALGGFTLFSDEGVSFLGPDLYSYEGTAMTDGTNSFSIYLEGNNFSVRGTQVIANGAQITNFTLLSRQLIEASLPGYLAQQTNHVDVLVATPYGVSSPVAVKLFYTGAPVAPPSPKTGYTWQINASSTTNYNIQITVISNHVLFPPIYADAQNPFPHIVRQLGDGADAVLLAQSGKLNFKISFLTAAGPTLLTNNAPGTNNISSTNNNSVLQITNSTTLNQFEFVNNQMLQPADFSKFVWPQITNFIGTELDHLTVSNVFPAGASLKLVTYLRLDDGTIVQADSPLMLPLSQ